jgi:hypothetical protein
VDRKRIGKHKRTHAGSYWCKHRSGGGRWLMCILENLRRKRRRDRRTLGMFSTVEDALNAKATNRRT